METPDDAACHDPAPRKQRQGASRAWGEGLAPSHLPNSYGPAKHHHPGKFKGEYLQTAFFEGLSSSPFLPPPDPRSSWKESKVERTWLAQSIRPLEQRSSKPWTPSSKCQSTPWKLQGVLVCPGEFSAMVSRRQSLRPPRPEGLSIGVPRCASKHAGLSLVH